MDDPQESEVPLRMDDSDTGSYSEQGAFLPERDKANMSLHRRLQLLCVAVHGGLVAIHVVLLVVYIYHLEHAAAFDISSFSTNWLPFIVTLVSQSIGTVSYFRYDRPLLPFHDAHLRNHQAYLTVLVLLTQHLALRGNLHTRQTLTAIHDKNIAWLGLGSALNSLWRQFSLPATVPGVLLITLYLLGHFTLHITIPSLFYVVPFNATNTLPYNTSLANFPLSERYVGCMSINVHSR